ncbi:MAG: retroviral-like aspartic protease family protein [Thermodesulfovibrionales bacterium]|nr:retroviral-like aspartic protease family protein [Thermodesulfovibrionales bacterium]
MNYTCYIKEGYLFVEIQGLGIGFIDSGAPASISDKERAVISGMEVRFTKSFLGQTVKTIGKLLDTEIDALIGGDILSKFDVFIDTGKGIMTFSQEPLQMEGIKERIEYPIHNIPVLTCKIEGTDYKFILDTGASLSYLNTEIAERFEITGKQTDFFPSFGKFETETRQIEIGIAGQEITLNFGTLPEILELTLGLAQADGLIGTELFDYYNIGLSRKRSEIVFQKPNDLKN